MTEGTGDMPDRLPADHDGEHFSGGDDGLPEVRGDDHFFADDGTNADHDAWYAGHDGGHPAYEHDDHPASALGFEAQTRAARRRAQAPRAARRFLILLLAVALVGGAGYLGYSVIKPMLTRADSSDYPGPGGSAVAFTVNDGDSGRLIAAALQRAGVVKTAQAFVDVCTADSRCAAIQPGDYALKTEMRAVDALAVLVDPKNRQNPKVTIREGLWASEIYPILAKATHHAVADYQAAATSAEVRALLPTSAKGVVEGYLFPATYEFSDKDSPATQLKTMIGKTVATLNGLGVTSDKAERLVIVASIVEAEARRPEDRAKVARVIENRLAKPMRLQLDSTVSYGVQKRAVTTTDAERATVNAWNTYTKDGLPTSPIANPGLASLQAAAAPADGPWLFFVAVNPETGETKFAATQAEHDQYVAEFQAWCNQPENKGKCTS